VVAVTYTVEVSREGGNWIADVVDVDGAHTYAGNLTALYENLYEVIGLVLDSPEGEEPPSLHLVFVDEEDRLIAEAARVGEERAAAEAETARLQAVIPDVARSLADAGYSMRDIAGALHLSAGRVSQVLSGSHVTSLPAAVKRSATRTLGKKNN
jgi:predicted RNase H-like HicB family nuclease